MQKKKQIKKEKSESESEIGWENSIFHDTFVTLQSIEFEQTSLFQTLFGVQEFGFYYSVGRQFVNHAHRSCVRSPNNNNGNVRFLFILSFRCVDSWAKCEVTDGWPTDTHTHHQPANFFDTQEKQK